MNSGVCSVFEFLAYAGMDGTTNLAVVDLSPYGFVFQELALSLIFWVCILNFGVCSVFEFLAYEGMNGTTNLAVVNLSPYGFAFKELALQSLILNEFLSCLRFGCL